MIRGLYTTVNGLITQEAKMDVITNNMANADTIGFKTDNLQTKKFNDVLIESYDRSGSNANNVPLGYLSLGSKIDETITNFTQGNFQDTDSITDFALNGRGFFTVRNNNGTTAQNYYTRNGHFHVNGDGLLVDDSGNSVLDTNGNAINVGANKFTCDANGNISFENSNNTIKLAVVDFNSNQPTNTAYRNLKKVGDNLYQTTDAPQASTAEVKQKSIEKSNVNTVAQMVDMITVMRNFETNQKILQSMDETLGKAVNEVGSVR